MSESRRRRKKRRKFSNDVSVIDKKRLVLAFMIFCLALVALCMRMGYIQIVKSDELKKKAISQQTKDEIVDAKRGEIVDRNGNKMAVSSLRYSIWVRPASVVGEEKTEADKKKKLEDTARELAAILGMDSKEIMEDMTQDIPLVKIAKYQSSAKANKIRKA